MFARLSVAVVIGCGCLGASLFVDLWGLWALDAGWDLSPTLAYGTLLAVTFTLALCIAHVVPARRRSWRPLAVACGATFGMGVTILTLRLLPDRARADLVYVLAVALPAISAFAGTFYGPTAGGVRS
jgi:hypothetical protein